MYANDFSTMWYLGLCHASSYPCVASWMEYRITKNINRMALAMNALSQMLQTYMIPQRSRISCIVFANPSESLRILIRKRFRIQL